MGTTKKLKFVAEAHGSRQNKLCLNANCGRLRPMGTLAEAEELK